MVLYNLWHSLPLTLLDMHLLRSSSSAARCMGSYQRTRPRWVGFHPQRLLPSRGSRRACSHRIPLIHRYHSRTLRAAGICRLLPDEHWTYVNPLPAAWMITRVLNSRFALIVANAVILTVGCWFCRRLRDICRSRTLNNAGHALN